MDAMINSKFQKGLFTSRLLLAVLVLVLFLVLFSTTWLNLYHKWMVFDESLSHGLFVFGLFCFWFVAALKSEHWIARKPVLWLLPLVAIAINSVFWSIFELVDIEILAILELPVLLFCVVWALYGFKQAINLTPIIGLIVFIIPIWDYLTPYLVDLSALIVGYLVGLMGMPALIEGNSITLPHGIILIADGCSGQRYLVISITLTYIASIMNRLPASQSILYLLSSILLGLLTNWIRIFGLVIIGYVTDMESSLLADHEFFGWVLFAVIVVPFLYFIPVYRQAASAQNATNARNGQSVAMFGPALTALTLFIGPALYLFSNNTTPSFNIVQQNDYLGFEHVDALPQDSPLMLPGNPLALEIIKNTRELYLVSAGWGRTESQKKIVPYFTRLYDHAYWQEEATAQHRLNNEYTYRTIQFRRKGYNQAWLLGYWYEVGSFHADTYSLAKLQQIPAILLGQNRFTIHSGVVECNRLDCEQQYQEMNAAFELISSKK